MARVMALWKRIAPGILVAATGVGAGDLVNASLAGSEVGLILLWAAWVGAIVKWYLNEGIARWQMATGNTLLQGWFEHLRPLVNWFFLPYLILWIVAVGGALIKACGVAGAALVPAVSSTVWGVLHSLIGLVLVLTGGFIFFEKMMGVCIGVMFVTVLYTAAAGPTDYEGFFKGLVSFQVPAGGIGWTLAVMGGVGGTVTLLSYGYWIAEAKREGHEGLKDCRLDLGIGYAATALFGIAMVLIGSRLELDGQGATVALKLAAQLEGLTGPAGRWLFLIGFWAAVFSSLLGVWQSVPYLVADMARLSRGTEPEESLENTRDYKMAAVALAIVPMPALAVGLKQIQLAYAVLGSLFMPFLAFTLLYLNNKKSLIGEFRNRWPTNLVLTLVLFFFSWQGYLALVKLVS